eukprot:4433276-Alexandrium_andersonii.AAC.1
MCIRDRCQLLGAAVAGAFRQAPLPPGEFQLAAVVLGGAYFYFRALAFGAASAPQAWGWFAAWLGRG